MSPQISQEALLIVMSLYGGLVLVVCYDMVRVCRRIFKVGIVSMIIQDVIYWTISAIFMFNIYLKYNYGRPRFFSIIFTLGIMALYEWLVGRKIVDRVAKFLCKVKIKLSATGDKTYEGTVTTINKQADFATKKASQENGDFDILTYGIKVVFDDNQSVQPVLRAGMTSFVDFGK